MICKCSPHNAKYATIVAFPALTLEQANTMLTETEGPGGGFLDDGSRFRLLLSTWLVTVMEELSAGSINYGIV
jgi:hypothetical protein